MNINCEKTSNLEKKLIYYNLSIIIYFATGAASAGENIRKRAAWWAPPGCNNNLHNKSVSLKVCVYYVVVCELAVLFLLF